MIHDDDMRPFAIASAVLHVAAIALLVLGLPPSDRQLDMAGSIPIDIVAIGPETGPARVEKGDPNAQAPKLPDVKPAPPAPPPPPAAEEQKSEPAVSAPEPPKLAQTPPPPREVQQPPRPTPPPPPPDPEPAPAPKPKPPEPKPPEPPKPEPPKPEPPKPEPPKPEPPKAESPKQEPPKKPEPAKTETAKTEPKKPEKDQLSSLLDNVLKDAPKSPSSASSAQSTSAAKPSSSSQSATTTGKPGAERASEGPDRAFAPSGRSLQAVQAAVGRNWNVDSGRRDAANLAVRVVIELAKDYTVVAAGIDDKDAARYRSDSAFRAAADAALRAVRRASPLPLPPEEFTASTYEKWRYISIDFDPKEML